MMMTRTSRLISRLLTLLLLSSLVAGCQAAALRAASATPTRSVATPTVAAAPASSSTSSPVTPMPVTTSVATAESTSTTAKVLDPLQPGGAGLIADVAARARPAVVQVTNEQLAFPEFGQGAVVPQGVGSGVIFDQDGHILTNNHVIAGAQKLEVSLPDGRSFAATLVGRDPRTDLAVIQIHGSNLPVLPLGDSGKLVVGQWVVAIGNALALPGGPTVSAGVISALGRTVQEPNQPDGSPGPYLFDVIQTDAPINPGNSGGPLVDLEGKVIGINTLAAVQAEPGVQAENIGFAIAINTAKAIADEIIRTGHVTYAYLGVSLYPNSPALAARFNLPRRPGEIIVSIDPSSPAARAGLRRGDVIVAVDGHALNDESEFSRILQSHRPGDQITLTIARGSSEVTVKVTLGTAPTG